MPSLAQVLTARRDLWGEEALRQTDGPSYEFFTRLLPPPRYVNADFRHYPIVLGSPAGTQKTRWVSNGSAINERGGHQSWHDVGIPIRFRCGPDEDLFGNDLGRVDGPRYLEGHLPIVQIAYQVEDSVYAQEVFAVADPLAAVFVKFSLARGTGGTVTVEIVSPEALRASGGCVLRADGSAWLTHGPGWRWLPKRKRLQATLAPGQEVDLAVFTVPAAKPLPLTPKRYEAERRRCTAAWGALIDRGAHIEVSEPIVNHAWRSMVIGTHLLIDQDRLCYSAGNQYDGVYVAEGGDAARALLLYGYGSDVRRLMPPILDRRRAGLESHQAAFKLQMLARYFEITRDEKFIQEQRARWGPEVERLVIARDPGTGLLPREQYCGDVAIAVDSLNANANAWRALRDMSVVLADIGEPKEGDRLARAAASLRAATLATVEKSVRRDAQPPFLPIALLGSEEPYDRIPATRMGSYYNLMVPYVLGSGIFGPGLDRESATLDYLHQHGGLAMGMTRSHPRPDLFTVKEGTNHLYGLRYDLVNLRRDDVDRVLVSFYGTLAQGFTRETFIGAESIGLVPLDSHGRPMYLPPNSAANAHFLTLLRHLLVQDWDLDDDGRPDTLRLLFATPGRWLDHGNEIRLERVPTAFGNVSLHARSRLQDGEVLVDLEAPPRPPRRMLLRVRIPGGRQIVAAVAGDRQVPLEPNGTADLSGLSGRFSVRFQVR